MSNSTRVLRTALMLWLIAAGAAVAQVHRADLRIDGLT